MYKMLRLIVIFRFAVISVALIMHDIPATEPIERSIPAVMRTND